LTWSMGEDILLIQYRLNGPMVQWTKDQ